MTAVMKPHIDSTLFIYADNCAQNYMDIKKVTFQLVLDAK